MKKYYYDVSSIRKYILKNACIVATDEINARLQIYHKLLLKGLLNDNLFYKIDIKLIENMED